MKIASAVVLLALLTTGCAGAFKITDTATMPPAFLPPGDPDLAALFEATNVLGLGAPPPATPQIAARALADVDYIAGAFTTHIRWYEIDPTIQEQLLIARRETRAAIGIAPHTLSQQVVDGLLAVSLAPDQAGMLKALANPIFTLGPQATLDRLEHLPKLATTPYALKHVDLARFGSYQNNRF